MQRKRKKVQTVLIENKIRDRVRYEIAEALASKHPMTKQGHLDIMFTLQKDFQEKNKWINFKTKSIKYKEERTQQMLFAVIEESIELKRELNLKEWKKERKEVDVDKVKEELIDIFHFIINIALIWGLSPEDLLEQFLEKQTTNRVRQRLGY